MQLLTHPVTGQDSPRNIRAYLRELISYLEFRNTVTVAAPDPYTNWKISNPAYTVQAGDVLRYDYWVNPLNPASGAGAMDLEFTTAPFTAGFAGVVDSAAVAIWTGPTGTLGAWNARTLDLTAIVGKVLNGARLVNAADTVGEYIARFRNIRITDAAGTTLRVSIWSSGDPAFNVDAGSQSNANQSAIAYDAAGWLGDPAHASLCFATEAGVREGILHEGDLSIFPAPGDSADGESGVQTGGGFKAELKVLTRALAPVLEFRARYGHSTNPYSYWKVAAPAYTILAGDVLRYDVWVDPKNPGAGGGAIELNFTTGSPANGRSVPLPDQNGTVCVTQPTASRGAWMSRTISLTAAAGKIISTVDLVNEVDAAIEGSYRALYRDIRITDAAGTTLRVQLWAAGTPSFSVSDYSAGATAEETLVYDAPLTADTAFNDYRQVLANPRVLLGKVMELTLASELTVAGQVVREVTDTRRARVVKAQLSQQILTLEFAELVDKVLDDLHPSETYTVADFAELFEGHVGQPIVDGVGLLRRVPMRWIKKTGGTWRHAIVKKRAGYTYAIQAIYRAASESDIGSVVPSGEYTQGTSTGTVSLLDVVDAIFTTEQLNATNQPYALSADILVTKGAGTSDASLATEEMRYLLALKGLSIDATSFAAAAIVADANAMRVAAGYVKPKMLRAILGDLAFIARAQLARTASGRLSINQDKASASAATFLEGSDPVAIEPVEYSDRPVRVKVHYRPARAGTEDYLATPITRELAGGLPEHVIDCPYVDSHELADRIADYWSKRDSIGEAVRATIHAVQAAPQDVINITGIGAWQGDRSWRVLNVSRPADKNLLDLLRYDAAVYTYTAQSLPAGATNVYTPDYSETAPAIPTSLSLTSGGTTVDATGKAFAHILVRAVPPTVNWSQLWVVAKNNVTNALTPRHELKLVGANYEVRVGNLEPGVSHDYLVFATNANAVTGVTATITATTASYASAPPTPTGQTAQQQAGNTLVAWIDNPAYAHHASVEWEVKVGAAAYAVNPETGPRLTVTGLTYGTIYLIRMRHKDLSGNYSSYPGSTLSITPSAAINDTHIAALGVGTVSLASQAATDAKVKLTSTVTSGTIGAGATVDFIIPSKATGVRIQQTDAAGHLQLWAANSTTGNGIAIKNVDGASHDYLMQLYYIDT